MVVNPSSQANPNGIPMSEGQERIPVKLILGDRTTYKKVKVEDNKDPDFRAVSKILKNAYEDILFEIFLRLPECRSAISSGAVCRLWHSVISHSQFIPRFIRHHKCNPPPFTIIFCKTGMTVVYKPFLLLFFKDTMALRGRSTPSGYVDFVSFIIWASYDDLLLLSPDASYDRVYYIGNPLTKQWSQLPKFPGGYMIGDPLGNPDGLALVCNKQLEYAPLQHKVVLIWALGYCQESQCAILKVRTFCFGSGQWSLSSFSYPRPNEERFCAFLDVITCNGILYWRESDLTFDRIIALDVFNSRCDIVDFPDDCVCGRQNSYGKAWIGVVCKALRLVQIFKLHKKCRVMKVWELQHKDDGSSSWVLIHERNMTRPNIEKLVRVSFHPNLSDVVYMMWGKYVFQYTITKDTYLKISEVEISINPHDRIMSIPVVHPPWPTTIPSIPTI